TRSGGERVPLTGKAFDTLLYLVEHAGEPVTRAALTDFLWPSTVVEENNLSQAVSVVRRTLGEELITTIARRGYQFTADVRKASPDAPVQAALGDRSGEAEGRYPRLGPYAHASSSPSGHARAAPLREALLRATAAAGVAVGAVWLLPLGSDSNSDPLEGYTFSKLTEFD